MKLKNIWNNDSDLKKVFTWLTRIGASPRLGSRPIGWYQQHQCAAIDYLEKHRFCHEKELRFRNGAIESLCPDGKTWLREISPEALFSKADNFCRTGKFN